jgi:hypothetical protein
VSPIMVLSCTLLGKVLVALGALHAAKAVRIQSKQQSFAKVFVSIIFEH